MNDNKLLLIDIETAPNFVLLSRLFPCPPPPKFNSCDVKLGNLKDASKIEAKIADAERAHAKSVFTWESDHEESMLSSKKVLLKPALSIVCATGTRMGDSDDRIALGDNTLAAEKTLLVDLAVEMRDAHAIIGWNIKGFDLPYLSFRWRVHGIDPPDICRPRGRYYDSAVIDLMEVVADHQYGNNSALKHVAPALGFPPCPEESGKNFWKTEPERQHRYLKWDVDAVYNVLQRYPEALNSIASL